MKKSVLLLLVIVSMSGNVLAQKGMSSLGLNVPIEYRKHNLSVGIGIKYQYNFTDMFRMEASASYSPIHVSSFYDEYLWNNSSGYEIDKTKACYAQLRGGISSHFFLMSPNPFRCYIIFGGDFADYYVKSKYTTYRTSWNSYSESYDTHVTSEESKKNRTSIRINLGVGFDYRISYKCSLQASLLLLKPIFLTKLNADGLSYNEFNGAANISMMYNL